MANHASCASLDPVGRMVSLYLARDSVTNVFTSSFGELPCHVLRPTVLTRPVRSLQMPAAVRPSVFDSYHRVRELLPSGCTAHKTSHAAWFGRRTLGT